MEHNTCNGCGKPLPNDTGTYCPECGHPRFPPSSPTDCLVRTSLAMDKLKTKTRNSQPTYAEAAQLLLRVRDWANGTSAMEGEEHERQLLEDIRLFLVR